MTQENILRCLSNVDSRYILEAAPGISAKKPVRWQRFLLVAVLILAIPLAALAAAAGFSLTDYLTNRGLETPETLSQLTQGPADISSATPAELSPEDPYIYFSTGSASFAVTEALFDSQTVYLLAHVKSTDDSIFLIPQYVSPEDPVSCLRGLEELADMTVGDYAASQGKTLAVASVSYSIEGLRLDGGEDFAYDRDGSLYYYFTARNPQGNTLLSVDCRGISYQDLLMAADKESVEFSFNLREKTESQITVYEKPEEAALLDTGIQILTLTLEETDFGFYATFEFNAENARFDAADFFMTDASGNRLRRLPGIAGTGTIPLGDGIFQTTVCFQRPASAAVEDLRFMIYDISASRIYGPYAFG